MVCLQDIILSNTIQPLKLKLYFWRIFKYMRKFAQYISILKATRLSKYYHASFIKEIIVHRHIHKLDEIKMSDGALWF